MAETRDPSHSPRGRPQAVLRCLEGRALWAWLLPAPGAPRALGSSDGSGASTIPLQSLVAPFLMRKPETPSWGGGGLALLCPDLALPSGGSDAENQDGKITAAGRTYFPKIPPPALPRLHEWADPDPVTCSWLCWFFTHL